MPPDPADDPNALLQPPFANSVRRIYATLSKVRVGPVSETYVPFVSRPTRSLKHPQLGSFHFVSGVDASSSASLAAYINSLTYAIEDTSAWFSKGPVWKVRNGCYCCFNAFSRVDVRVDVKIPGGVHAYVVDLRGERCVVLGLGGVRNDTDMDARGVDTMRHRTCGRKRMCRRCSVLSCIRTIRRIGWKRIASWIRLRRARARCGSCKLSRPCL